MFVASRKWSSRLQPRVKIPLRGYALHHIAANLTFDPLTIGVHAHLRAAAVLAWAEFDLVCQRYRFFARHYGVRAQHRAQLFRFYLLPKPLSLNDLRVTVGRFGRVFQKPVDNSAHSELIVDPYQRVNISAAYVRPDALSIVAGIRYSSTYGSRSRGTACRTGKYYRGIGVPHRA